MYNYSYTAMLSNALKTVNDSYNAYEKVSRFTNIIEELKK